MFAIDYFASWDNPVNWWPSLIDYVLDPISHGARTLSYPRCQWSREETRDAVREQWLQWLDQEDEFFIRDSPEDYADIVVGGVKWVPEATSTRSGYCQLNEWRNSDGESFVFVLNNLLNDCGCSNPSA